MDTNNQIPATSGNQPAFSQRMQHSKALIAIAAVLGVTVMALAAALVVNRSDAQPGGTDALAPTTQSSTTAKLASNTTTNNTNNTNDTTTTPARLAPAKPAVQQRPVVVAQAPTQAQAPAPRPVACADCGTVEAVTPVQRQGDVNGVAVGDTTIGLGTVAGGVVGGLLGNQVGGGSGKTAMTVLGAAGGAFAGNQIEKNMKKVTVYQVRVRMNDGSTRNVEVSSSIPVGSRVIVEGKNLRMA